MNKVRASVGFLCYDLQPFTEDCLYRIAKALDGIAQVKAFPIFFHPAQEEARVPYVPSKVRAIHLGVDRPGNTPEGLTSSINWNAARRCAVESDVVIFFGLQGATAILTSLIAVLFGRTLISVNQTLPIEWEKKRRWWIRLLKRWLLARCHLHVYQTPVSREALIHVYGCRRDQLFFAPFEAGASWFSSFLNQRGKSDRDIKNEMGFDNEIIFLFVGSLLPFKGISDLLTALTRLPRQGGWFCLIAGPEEPRCKGGGTIAHFTGVAKSLGINERVRFLGRLKPDKLARLYRAADVVVLPTHKDCFPKVLVEGALAAKPLITTSACGAAGCLVRDRENGYVVSPGDIVALATAMTNTLNEETRRRMGRRSLGMVREFCDPRVETCGYVQAIRTALAIRLRRAE
jgi:glycosyltransferase involved in cell wall biosynthesis